MRAIAALVILATLPLAGCLGGDDVAPSGPPPGTVLLPGAVIETPQGTMTIVLYPALAPRTVEQFTGLARAGWYNGSIFHRTVDNFVIQGGAPPEGRTEAETLPLEPGGFFAAGAVGIARDTEPDSGTSQFFVCEYPQPHLRDPDPLQSPLSVAYGEFTVFGQIVDGMDVVRASNELPHDASGEDRPRDPPPMIVSYRVVEVNATVAKELPYRTWGRTVAPPYRVSLDSPGALPVARATWLRVFVEDMQDRSQDTGLVPTIAVSATDGRSVPIEVARDPADGNIHRIGVTFPWRTTYVVEVADGVRPLARFNVVAS